MTKEEKKPFVFDENELLETLKEGESYYVDLIAKGEYENDYWGKNHDDQGDDSN